MAEPQDRGSAARGNRLLVPEDDLVPVLFTATDEEMQQAVEWLKEHGAEGLPAMLARFRVSMEYRLAWDARHIGAAFSSISLKCEWVPEKRRRTLIGRLKGVVRRG